MQAGVVRLDQGLHVMCAGCLRADWQNNICTAYTTPREIWANGECWAWEDEETRELKKAKRKQVQREELQTQFQQARCPGPWEDPLAWLMATKPPSIRDKEPILQLPAPPAGKSSSRSRKKRKKRLPWSINILYEK